MTYFLPEVAKTLLPGCFVRQAGLGVTSHTAQILRQEPGVRVAVFGTFSQTARDNSLQLVGNVSPNRIHGWRLLKGRCVEGIHRIVPLKRRFSSGHCK